MKKNEPENISYILERLSAGSAIKNAADLLKIKENWSEIVGGLYSRHSRVISLKEGELHISFDNAVWKSEFYLSREKIVEKINEFMGFIVVRTVVLV